MKVLVTSNDQELIGELSYYLRDEGIDIHVGNHGTSSLPGSGSYQQSIYVLNPHDYNKAQKILSDFDESRRLRHDDRLSVNEGEIPKNSKWLVLLLACWLRCYFV